MLGREKLTRAVLSSVGEMIRLHSMVAKWFMLSFVSGHNGNLIVESFRPAEVSLSKVWENVVLNILPVQSDYDPIHNTAARILVVGRGRYIARDRMHKSWGTRFKLPARQRAPA